MDLTGNENPPDDAAQPGGEAGPGVPMRLPDPMRFGQVWCGAHGRWECSRLRSKERGPCHQWPVAGTNSCRMHGGKSGAALKADGERAIAEAETKKLINLQADPISDPVEELAKLAGVVKAFAERLTDRIEELSDLTVTTESGSEQVRAVVGLWERMVRQSEALLGRLASLGLEERSVRLREREVDLVSRVVLLVAQDLVERIAGELREGDASRLRAAGPVLIGEVVPARLRELAGGPGAGLGGSQGGRGASGVG